MILVPYFYSYFIIKNLLFDVDLLPWTFDMESPNSVVCNLPPPEPADQGRLHLPGVGGQPGVRHEEEDGHQGQTDGCSTVLLTLHPPFPGVHRPRQHAHLHLLHEAPQVVDDQDQEAHLHPQAHVKE